MVLDRAVEERKSVLVVGGGIAGITAALELAECGVHVTLLEEGPSIGGRMIQLDKTFPTLDCSTCTLSPKMVEIALNPMVDLLTWARPVSVRQVGSRFDVGILKKARYVDVQKCTACGSCWDGCPVSAKSEFNMGLGDRKAIYIPFPQAIPNKASIDKDACIECGKCEKRCDVQAIDHSMEDELVTMAFDGVVVAPGFDVYDPSERGDFGYGRFEGVLTSLEFERLCSVTGPTGGELTLNGKVPKRFYFIQCVGSRDRRTGARFCSRVCCMYTAKHASIVLDRVKGAQVYVSYIDVRAYGKNYEEFYKSTQESGAVYIRGIPGQVTASDDGLLVRVEDMLSGELREIEVDLVVLATGVRPRRGTEELCAMMSLDRDEYGFIKTDALAACQSSREGIFVCGMASGPKDVPDTVASGGEAASRCLEYVHRHERAPVSPQARG